MYFNKRLESIIDRHIGDLEHSTTDHFGESLGATSSRQKTQHHFRGTKNGFLTLGCNSVLAGDGKLKANFKKVIQFNTHIPPTQANTAG